MKCELSFEDCLQRGLMSLSSLKKMGCYLPPIGVQHMYRSFFRAQKRAGLERHFRFHDLRHTFASHFMMNGGNLYDLQKILGHSKIEMTLRYAHLAPDHLVEAINVVNFSTSDNVEMLPLKVSGNV